MEASNGNATAEVPATHGFPGQSPLSAEALKSGSEAPAIIEAAQAATAPHKLDEDLFATQFGVQVTDLESYRDTPRRAKGTYKPATLDSFIDYVNDSKGKDGLSIWVDPNPEAPRVVAVLNDHADADKPAWRDYRVDTRLNLTDEWQHWVGEDGRMMTQVEFAEHLEEGVTELIEPAAADMLEIAQSIHLTNNATFRSDQRLKSGQVKVAYDEEIDGTAGPAGELEIPTEFKLAIAPFLGESAQEITARLRYRLNHGQLAIGYRLNRPNQILLDALEAIVTRLDGQFKDKVYMGAPPA